MLTTLEPFLTVTSPYRGYLTDEILCEDGNYIQIETADYYIALQVLTSYFDPILAENSDELYYENIALDTYIAKEV